MKLEKEIQSLIERNLEDIFGIRFLATEYSTGEKHRGRIDSLGIDENDSPVIIEYKKYKSGNIINQGLYYMNWLEDHKANFEMLVLDRLGKRITVDWSSPRILCIAEDFTKYDFHMIEQINKSIELIRYQKFEDELLLFELLAAKEGEVKEITTTKSDRKTINQIYNESSEELKDLASIINEYILSLGDDVQKREQKFWWAYKKIRNFASLLIYKNQIRLYIPLIPSELGELPKNMRDVTDKGHYGSGDLEIDIVNQEEFEKVKSYIEKSYRES